jgi:ubiquinone biosynthesis protein Coq4
MKMKQVQQNMENDVTLTNQLVKYHEDRIVVMIKHIHLRPQLLREVHDLYHVLTAFAPWKEPMVPTGYDGGCDTELF